MIKYLKDPLIFQYLSVRKQWFFFFLLLRTKASKTSSCQETSFVVFMQKR